MGTWYTFHPRGKPKDFGDPNRHTSVTLICEAPWDGMRAESYVDCFRMPGSKDPVRGELRKRLLKCLKGEDKTAVLERDHRQPDL